MKSTLEGKNVFATVKPDTMLFVIPGVVSIIYGNEAGLLRW